MRNHAEIKNLKVWILALAFLIVCPVSLQSFKVHAKEEPPIKKDYSIQVNGTVLKDTCAYKSKKSLLIPLRQTAEAIGFKVIWETKTKSVRIDDGKVKYRIYIGKDSLYELDSSLKQKEKQQNMPDLPIKIGSKVYVPCELYQILYGTEDVVQLKGNTVDIQTEPDITAGMPNPLKKMNTVEEAEKAAGFTIPIPEIQGKPGIPDRIIVIDNNLIELHFIIGDQEISYRKGTGTQEISGDYTIYNQVKTEKAGNTEVTLKGDNDNVTLAIWNINDNAYALRYKNPVPADEAIRFVTSVIK